MMITKALGPQHNMQPTLKLLNQRGRQDDDQQHPQAPCQHHMQMMMQLLLVQLMLWFAGEFSLQGGV